MPAPQKIKSDNKNYLFTPGKGGSLISTDKKPQTGLNIQSNPSQAKVVGQPKYTETVSDINKKRRSAIVNSIAAARG